jgi:MinD superfamily P-loop ATPase
LISQNLFWEAVQRGYPHVQLAGFDVEKPDLFEQLEIESPRTEKIYAPQPVIEVSKCRFCGVCSGYCVQKAIQFNRFVPSVTLIVSRCCACGNCQKACSRNGIQMKEKYVGEIVQGNLGKHRFIAGDLDLESEFQVPLIKAILEKLNPEAICICDFSPGTDLPVSLAIEKMDIAIIVVQNTPDWKQHLNDMLSITGKSNIHTGLVINKMEESSTFPGEVEEYCNLKSLHIWGIIPHFGTLENSKDFRSHNRQKDIILPVSTIWDSITKSHPSFQITYNETFTQY